MIKVVAFNGSPRVNGNTAHGLRVVLEELQKEGIETELVQLGGSKVYGCQACYKCYGNKDRRCARDDDDMNTFIAKAVAADGIIIGSPVYFSNVSPEVKAFIDRCGFVAKANDSMLRRKVGASVIAVRRAGATFAYSAINLFFGISEMIVPCSSYWNMGIGRNPGEILKDEEGMQTFKTLGQNMGWLLKKLAANPGETK